MAECVASPSFIKWRMRSYGKERGCVPHNSNFTMAQRLFYYSAMINIAIDYYDG